MAVALREGRLRENKDIIESLNAQQSQDTIQFRKHDRPWEIVPQFVRRRVVDLTGILTSAHRMEMEQAINSILPICDINLYVVIVPTVGYVSPRVFAQSLFFDWGVGEPRGNGVLLLVCKQEASVQLIASPAICEYFDQRFCDLLVEEILGPHVKDGKASYGLVQAVYALARHSQEMRHDWQRGLLTLPTRNKVRFAEKTFAYGIHSRRLFIALALTAATVWMWSQILDMMCPDCGIGLHKVVDEELINRELDAGQRLERDNGCTQFKILKCPKCKKVKVTVLLRDLYNNTKCLPCEGCKYNTVKLQTSVERLPSKTEDGIKKHLYTCEHCRLAREITLPLFRPIDTKPPQEWYNFLVQGAASHKPVSSGTINNR